MLMIHPHMSDDIYGHPTFPRLIFVKDVGLRLRLPLDFRLGSDFRARVNVWRLV